MRAPHRNSRQHGLTLIETMIALTVLSVGMMAMGSLLMTSIASDTRNTTDTRGTLVAQMVAEQIAAKSLGTSFTMTDCNPSGATTWTISTAGAASPGAGANLDGNGNIDFTQSYSTLTTNFPGYAMLFVTCGSSTASAAVYDVRWNVKTLNTYSVQVTVSARQTAVTTNGTLLRYFSPPVTLKTVAGQ